MDSLTHIVVGACIGEAFLGKKIGKKALAWGAVAHSVPDIDFVAATWTSTTENLLAHRGFTHSFLFCVVVAPFLALLANRFYKSHNIGLRKWIRFFGTAIGLHLILDGFNTYGTGWLEPFSHFRVSLNTIFVADPLFSIVPAIASTMLLILNRNAGTRKFWWGIGLAGSLVYLTFCTINKIIIEKDVREGLATQHIQYDKYLTTPTPFNNLLWYVVAGNDTGFYVGFRSIFDESNEMKMTWFPRNEPLLRKVADHENLQQLKRFSKGFYTIEEKNGFLIFNDLRFGQIAGWSNPRADFVFYYYLQHPEENDLIVQRGRFKGWNREVWISLFDKISGN